MVATAVAPLAELAALDDESVVARLRELELEHRRREAEIAVLVGEAQRRRLGAGDGHRHVRNLLRAELNWSPLQTVRRRRLAALFDLVPDTFHALWQGRIGIAQADEIARARANPRCGDLLADSADLLVGFCEQLDFDDARACIQRWEIHADLDGAHRDRQSSEHRRRAVVTSHDNGLHVEASGGSSIDAAEMIAIFDTFVEAEFRNDITHRTEQHGPDPTGIPLARTDAQRRFDALHTIFRAAAANPTHAPTIPMLLNIIIDDVTFQHALADHALTPAVDPLDTIDPATARCDTDTGIQLLPDDAIRAALHGHIRRVVIDSAGTVTNVGRKRRLFTGVMRDIAKLLARHCTAPGCTIHTRFAQIDHVREWATHHGHTSLDNAAPACSHHNRHKHRHRQHVQRRPDGHYNWYRANGTRIAPVGQPHTPDKHDIHTAIRQRLDNLITERHQP
jgi:hypothetical protein